MNISFGRPTKFKAIPSGGVFSWGDDRFYIKFDRQARAENGTQLDAVDLKTGQPVGVADDAGVFVHDSALLLV